MFCQLLCLPKTCTVYKFHAHSRRDQAEWTCIFGGRPSTKILSLVMRSLVKWGLVMFLTQTIQNWWINTNKQQQKWFLVKGSLNHPKTVFSTENSRRDAKWSPVKATGSPPLRWPSKRRVIDPEVWPGVRIILMPSWEWNHEKRDCKGSQNPQCSWLGLLFSRKLYTGF